MRACRLSPERDSGRHERPDDQSAEALPRVVPLRGCHVRAGRDGEPRRRRLPRIHPALRRSRTPRTESHSSLGRSHAAQRQLDAISLRANEVAAELDREQGRLERLTSELLQTQMSLAQARERYDAIVSQLNERARTLFMQGPGSELEFLLGASSFTDLTDRLEYVNVVATNDADLATEVQNTKNVLSAKEKNLESLQSAQQSGRRQGPRQAPGGHGAPAAGDRDVQRDRVEEGGGRGAGQEAVEEAPGVAANRSSRTAARRTRRSRCRRAGRARSQVCPVGQPRAYGDGFGAPRYAGGYHLHAGVDILAPYGTPIYATFDGYATQNPNGLGGLAVIVRGAPGYTYNAHLSSYSDHSTGPVQAGDVIGYVGSTGDAGTHQPQPLRVPPELVPVGMADELLRVHGDRRRAEPVPAVRRRLRLV